MMTGDEKAVGTKFGIAFTGKWVWKMKDYIDVSFMNLFNKNYLFHDYETKGYAEPVTENVLYEEEKKELQEITEPIRAKVGTWTAEECGQALSVGEEQEDFWEQLFTLDRMAREEGFADAVKEHFKPDYQ